MPIDVVSAPAPLVSGLAINQELLYESGRT